MHHSDAPRHAQPVRPAHTVYEPNLVEADPNAPLDVVGDEAHHARASKRLQPGDAVRVIDGRGRWAVAPVASFGGNARNPVMTLEPPGELGSENRPTLVVASPIPKGDRAEGLVDQLSQVGVGVWQPIVCARSEQRELRRRDRLERRAVESVKQCGRAWLLEIREPVSAGSLFAPGAVLADASGGEASADASVVLVGPEGGWSDEERAHAKAAGVRTASFGVYVMQIETAAVVAAGTLLTADRLRGPGAV